MPPPDNSDPHGAIHEDAISMTTEAIGNGDVIVIELQAAILLVLSDEETSESESVKTSTNLRFDWAQVIRTGICSVPDIIKVFNIPKYITNHHSIY